MVTHRGASVHVCKASRKDYRDAVEAARRAQAGWAGSTAYLRGQILYRMAEMVEGKRGEFEALCGGVGRGERGADVGVFTVSPSILVYNP